MNKHILLGVTGGIAAYKSADLVRRLRDAGAEVRVVMTTNAEQFITPLTMQAVAGYPVYRELLDVEAESGMGHIELARWADVCIVAPATADFIATHAQGAADDLLSTIILATRAPLAIAPAMNQQMWHHPATQANMATLMERGVHILGPGVGSQACGDTGPGRMLEPGEIADKLSQLFDTGSLAGIKVVVTAGPTWESMDPVRGFSNRSSGKMGYAIAEAAAEAGAKVVLVSGPTALGTPQQLECIHVSSAREMLDAAVASVSDAGIFIGVAAVADYRPRTVSGQKIKKDADTLTIEMVKNPDILATVAAQTQNLFTVGFAAETEQVEQHARLKLVHKGVDLIAANQVGENLGFAADENKLTLVDRTGISHLPKMRKSELARVLIKEISERFHAKNTTENTRRAHR